MMLKTHQFVQTQRHRTHFDNKHPFVMSACEAENYK